MTNDSIPPVLGKGVKQGQHTLLLSAAARTSKSGQRERDQPTSVYFERRCVEGCVKLGGGGSFFPLVWRVDVQRAHLLAQSLDLQILRREPIGQRLDLFSKRLDLLSEGLYGHCRRQTNGRP